MIFSRNYLTVLIVGLFSISVFATNANRLEWRIFTKDPNTWVYNKEELILFSSQSRTVKMFDIDASRNIESILDCIEGEGYLWISTSTGTYQIDMSTQSVERLPAPPEDTTAAGKVAVDPDYLWLGTKDKLFRFDRLAREWFSFSLPARADNIIGLWTNGDEVFVLSNNILYRFTTSTEKWNQYPLEKPFSEKSIFYSGKDGFKVLDGGWVYRYLPSSLSWTSVNLNGFPDDIFDEDSLVYFSRKNDFFSLNLEKEVISRINLPEMQDVMTFSKMRDSLLILTKDKAIKGSIKTLAVSFLEYPQKASIKEAIKVIPTSKFIIVFTKASIFFYDQSNRAWEEIKIKESATKKILRWNEDGLVLNYSKGFSSKLTGSIQGLVSLKSKGYEYDTIAPTDTFIRNDSMIIRNAILDTTDSVLVMELKNPVTVANLNLHTTAPNDRVMDLFFNNTSTISVPQKGIYYRGNRNDYLSNINIGSTNNNHIASSIFPSISMEGVTATIESKARLKERDKKILSLSGGTGYVTTHSVWKVLHYRTDGVYYLKSIEDSNDTSNTAISSFDSSVIKDSTIIVPGSIKVYVDGVLLDSNYYTFSLQTGKLELRSSAPVDPVSMINVNYKIQTKPPKGIEQIEFIPTRFFKKLHYGVVTYSPTEWISPKIGFTGIEEQDSLSPITNLSIPLEIRKKTPNLMVKATPEFFYDTRTNAKAGSGSLQGRIGDKAGIVLTGMWLDTNFRSTDTLTRGYGKILNEYDLTLSYDIKQELPIKYNQYYRKAIDGIEKRYETDVSILYPNYPFLNLSISRIELDLNENEEGSRFDSLFNIKDKLGVRIYEKNSTFLTRLTKFNKIGYDIYHSEYRYTGNDNVWKNGRLTSTFFLLNPVQKITILNKIIYRGGMDFVGSPTSDVTPLIQIQTVDAPSGVDFLASYQLKYSRFSSSITDTIIRSFDVVLRPGNWLKHLQWMSPRGRFYQNRSCIFSSTDFYPIKTLAGGGDAVEQTSGYGAGINITPSNSFLLRNMNDWSISSKSKKFSSSNDILYWIDGKNYFQGIWNYTTDYTSELHNSNISYNRVWTPWLRTIPAFQFNISKDSTGNKIIKGGPKLTGNFTLYNILFIKNLFNSHDFFISWERKNEVFTKDAEWGYTFNLQLILFPNIQITNYESILFKGNQIRTLESRLNLVMNF